MPPNEENKWRNFGANVGGILCMFSNSVFIPKLIFESQRTKNFIFNTILVDFLKFLELAFPKEIFKLFCCVLALKKQK